MAIANRVKALRLANDLSQSDLAEKIKVSQSTIAKIEINRTDPSFSTVMKLANFFYVSTDYLIGREEEDGRIVIQENPLPQDERQLLSYYRKLPLYQKETILNNAKMLYDIKTNPKEIR